MDSQLFLIRAKKLGMKIAIARQKAGLSYEDLAERSGIDVPSLIEMEKGISSPSLPQLQFIASIIQMPLNDLINIYALAPIPAGMETSALPKYFEIRNRMLGIQVKKNRLSQEVTESQLAQYCDLDEGDIEAYESGQKAIPFLHLLRISELLHLPYELQSTVESSVPATSQVVGETTKVQEVVQEPVESTQPTQPIVQSEISTTSEINEDILSGFSDELRAFITKPANLPFLELAVKLSKMDAKKLRDIAESILEITL